MPVEVLLNVIAGLRQLQIVAILPSFDFTSRVIMIVSPR
jgi:hypothetical protein